MTVEKSLRRFSSAFHIVRHGMPPSHFSFHGKHAIVINFPISMLQLSCSDFDYSTIHVLYNYFPESKQYDMKCYGLVAVYIIFYCIAFVAFRRTISNFRRAQNVNIKIYTRKTQRAKRENVFIRTKSQWHSTESLVCMFCVLNHSSAQLS